MAHQTTPTGQSSFGSPSERQSFRSPPDSHFGGPHDAASPIDHRYTGHKSALSSEGYPNAVAPQGPASNGLHMLGNTLNATGNAVDAATGKITQQTAAWAQGAGRLRGRAVSKVGYLIDSHPRLRMWYYDTLVYIANFGEENVRRQGVGRAAC